MTTLNIAAVRADFPLLTEGDAGDRLIYLDSGATTQTPQSVIDAEVDFLVRANSAVHRGAHTLASEATELFEEARATVAAFIGTRPEQLVWTSGASAGLNLVAYALGNSSVGRGAHASAKYVLRRGDEIVVSEIEHHANLVPWQELAARTGAVLRHIPVRDDGVLDMEAATAIIGDRTRVVAFAHVSNVLGVVNPVQDLVTLARNVGALTVLDACQSAPHLSLDMPSLGVDLAVFSGHKLYGPYGVGALYGRAAVLEALPPFLTGGSMVTAVALNHAEYLPPPQRFEAGTPPVSQAIGLASAVRYLGRIGMESIYEHERALERQLRHGLQSIAGVRLLRDNLTGRMTGAGGTKVEESAERVSLCSFSIEGVHPHDVGQYLDSHGIAVRVGHHCAQPLHDRFGLSASVRASAALYNTPDEIDVFLDVLSGVRTYFGVAS